jgi:hypothetical protein
MKHHTTKRTMRSIFGLTLLVSLALAPATRLAAAPRDTEGADTSASPPRPDVTDVPAVQRFEFQDEDVLGDTTGPEGEPLTVVVPAKHPSLIEIRRHFVPEMVKSLEDL